MKKPENPNKLAWETIYDTGGDNIFRTEVPGGWLIKYVTSITFYPDPQHEWLKSTESAT